MKMLARLFAAFCVATILAQAIILGLAGARGNLKRESLMKAVALLNGIDISGDQLQKMLDDSRQEPIPSYEDVRDARARESTNLQMREDSVRRLKEQAEEMLAELRLKVVDFDRRKDEFYKLLEEKEQKLLDASLQEVQRTLEALGPEQAKEQLKKLLEADQKDDVVAIVKGMPLDKRKKILGEFTGEEEADQLHEILKSIRAGEPTAGLIQASRDQSASP